MKVPINWLEDYVKVNMDLEDLMWKMTEVGMTTEAFEKVGEDIVLDVEVTPNRPDWLSILGIAREVGAIQNKNIKHPKTPQIPNKEADLPISVNINHKLSSRYSAITIQGVEVKDSPDWMQKYLNLIGLRPINSLVDITNFVMFELGVPIHVFDYDKFAKKDLKMQLSKGGETFVSVDGEEYELPENAIIIKDDNRVIDLCGIKGGENTSIDKNTKNIYIHVPIYTPQIIRKTSQKLKLSSDASYIYERGADAGGTIKTLSRVVDLILKNSGGAIASEVIDVKQKDFVANRIVLDTEKLEEVVGIKFSNRDIVKLLKRLDFRPESRGETISCTIPTYRQDVKIQEDIIEEVARMYGYNEFPKTLPISRFRQDKIPFTYDYKYEQRLKQIMISGGYNETQNLALISKNMIENSLLPNDSHIKLANPVSKEYKYLRRSLMPSLLKALKTNENVEDVKLFEYGKVFIGPVNSCEEKYSIAAITNEDNFRSAKGMVDLVLDELNIDNINIKTTRVEKSIWHPSNSAILEKKNIMIGSYGYINPRVLHNYGIDTNTFGFEFEVDSLKKLTRDKKFVPVTKYPPHFEDITLEPDSKVKLIDIIDTIRHTSKIIRNVELREVYKNKYTLRIQYQHKGKTLEDKDIEKLRNKFIKKLKNKNIKIDL